MEPLLFLDFDGVLHPTSGRPNDRFCRGELLGEALAGSRCAIVISSSWRHHYSLGELIEALPSSLRDRVIGATGDPHVGRWPRYNEIATYLRQVGGGAAWRALDDSWIEFPEACAQLIVCDPNVGFAGTQAAQLRRWLAKAL